MNYEETLDVLKSEIDLLLYELKDSSRELYEIECVSKITDMLIHFSIYWKGFYLGLANADVEYDVLKKLEQDVSDYWEDELNKVSEINNSQFKWDAMVYQAMI